ncbi:hypothetical protein, partial [Methylobacterium frigidaeris]
MNLFKLPRLGSRKKGEGLDVKFYRNYYADMSGASDREVFKHWEEFGRAEGRFANEALARDSA